MKKIIKTVFLIVFLVFLSWISTCGIIKLITVCFGLQFNWMIATGIWLILCVIQSMFLKNN